MSDELILVVDDDPDIVQFITMVLEDEGYQVVSAVNGGALALASDRHPAAILLDIMMPKMDGIEVSRRLRANPETASIPIIAMSASERLKNAGSTMAVDDGLAKPFSLVHLTEKVARWTRSV
jgi:CheY-like chemotaxis protein